MKSGTRDTGWGFRQGFVSGFRQVQQSRHKTGRQRSAYWDLATTQAPPQVSRNYIPDVVITQPGGFDLLLGDQHVAQRPTHGLEGCEVLAEPRGIALQWWQSERRLRPVQGNFVGSREPGFVRSILRPPHLSKWVSVNGKQIIKYRGPRSSRGPKTKNDRPILTCRAGFRGHNTPGGRPWWGYCGVGRVRVRWSGNLLTEKFENRPLGPLDLRILGGRTAGTP